MITLATPADYPALARVYRRASLANTGDRDALLAHPEHLILDAEGLEQGRTYVARDHGSVVGFASWIESAGGAELADLFVDPLCTRRGSATALVLHIVDVLRSRGVPTLEVTANPQALGFYRAVGFRDVGTADTAFGPAPRMAFDIT